MPASRAPLILFSGIDGGGKSTQIERLTSVLRERWGEPVVFWSRGGYTPGFERLKRGLRRGTGSTIMPPAGRSAERSRSLRRPWIRRAWLALAVLDLLWWYGVRVRGWRRRGRAVILDRYWLPTD